MRIFSEKNIYIWFLVFLAFAYFVYNKDLALIYIAFIFIDKFIKDTYPSRIRVDLNTSPGNTFQAIMWGLIAFFAFMLITTFLATFLQAALNFAPEEGFSAVWQQVIRHSASSSKPIFEGNPYFIFVVFGIIIAVTETKTLIARLFDYISDMFNVSLNKLSLGMVAIWVLITGIFVLFHIQAKGLTDNVGLLATAIFSIISLYLIYKFKEAESATYFHIFWNSTIIYNQVFMKGGAMKLV